MAGALTKGHVWERLKLAFRRLFQPAMRVISQQDCFTRCSFVCFLWGYCFFWGASAWRCARSVDRGLTCYPHVVVWIECIISFSNRGQGSERAQSFFREHQKFPGWNYRLVPLQISLLRCVLVSSSFFSVILVLFFFRRQPVLAPALGGATLPSPVFPGWCARS